MTKTEGLLFKLMADIVANLLLESPTAQASVQKKSDAMALSIGLQVMATKAIEEADAERAAAAAPKAEHLLDQVLALAKERAAQADIPGRGRFQWEIMWVGDHVVGVTEHRFGGVAS